MAKEEKQLYKIIAQKEGITITATTSEDVTFDEAKNIAITSVLGGVDKLIEFEPMVLIPITTKERWEYGTINFCPRCGTSLQDEELERYADVYCHECNASMEIQIFDVGDDDE